MSIAPRDRDALTLVRDREYRDGYLASFEVDMQTLRLTLQLYGKLRGVRDGQHYLGTVTFFGANGVAIANERGTFPSSARVSAFEVAYDDGEDVGAASLRGTAGWEASWAFDGIAYAEHPAIMASLADEGDA